MNMKLRISELRKMLAVLEAVHGNIEVATVAYYRGGARLYEVEAENVAVYSRSDLTAAGVEDADLPPHHPNRGTPEVVVLTSFEGDDLLTRR